MSQSVTLKNDGETLAVTLQANDAVQHKVNFHMQTMPNPLLVHWHKDGSVSIDNPRTGVEIFRVFGPPDFALKLEGPAAGSGSGMPANGICTFL